MGRRIRYFANCKLPNPFPLTPVNMIFIALVNTTDFYGSKANVFFLETPQPIFTDPSQHHHLKEKLQKSLTKQYHSCFHQTLMMGLPDFSAAFPHHLRLYYIKYGQKKVILTYLFVIIKATIILHNWVKTYLKAYQGF